MQSVPDGTESLLRMYGPGAGSFNLSRFKLPEMDALYEKILLMPAWGGTRRAV